jgi:hypothetical protein
MTGTGINSVDLQFSVEFRHVPFYRRLLPSHRAASSGDPVPSVYFAVIRTMCLLLFLLPYVASRRRELVSEHPSS